MANTLEGSYYLVVHKKNWRGLSARLSNKNPALKAGEVAIKISVAIPSGLFERPQIQAKIVIPENSITPKVLDATVLDNVREVLEAQTGFDVRVSIVDSE